MAEIFVSYSRQDKTRVAPLVAALEAEGWSVWWDPEITPGQEFDALITKELEAAKALVVVWTPTSVDSRWVRGEARDAADRGVLVPVRFDGAKLPIDFRAVHATDLDGWSGESGGAPFRSLCKALEGKLGAARKAGAGSARDTRAGASICVLPFANMSGDPEQEYFSDGITEDIITDLSKVSVLAVSSRNSAFAYKGKTVDIIQVARQLRVSHVLEGSVRKAGNRLRISAQLIDAATNNHLWAERYDRDLSDIFTLQDEISQAIVGALKLKLLPEEKKAIERRDTTNTEAYKLYLMARQYLVTTSERHRPLVIRLCERAVEIDPNYARAWALLALGHSNVRLLSGASGDSGWEAANRALALDPGLAEAHAARGRILADQGRYQEAVVEHEIAVRLDPDSYDVNCAAGRCYTGMRRYDDAIRHFEKAASLVETEIWASGMVNACYLAKRDMEGAKRAARQNLDRVERALAFEPDHSAAMGFGVNSLVTLGENERAKEWMERALLLAPPDDLNLRYNLACAMSRLGEIDLAINLLEFVLPKQQLESLELCDVDTDLDAVREHPRYQACYAAARARFSQPVEKP